MESLFEALGTILKPDYSVHELVAIWITEPVINTPDGKHARWVIGDKCCIKDGELVDFKNHNEANSIITSCRGDIYNTVLEFSIMDLKTNQLSIVKIK